MPSYNLKRFSNPKVLKSVAPETLGQFLSPHREFLDQKGFILPADCSTLSDFDYLSITAILMKPDDGMPADLTDSLYFTHEMATDKAMDDLLELANQLGQALPDECTPLDVAMRLWITDRYALERKHSKKHMARTRTFEHYQADAPMAFAEPSAEAVAAMESSMDEWFIEHKRGGNSRLFIYPGSDGVWFLVRHGDSYKRESAVEGDRSRGVLFRPEAFDVVCYLPSLGELRVHTEKNRKGEKDLYRREFGKLVAGNSSHFPGFEKYTFIPLVHDGEKSLICSDVDGIDHISLCELHVTTRTVFSRYIIAYKGPNVFSVLAERGIVISPSEKIDRAVFSIRFTDSETTRRVTIIPPNRVELSRDGDSGPVENWLRRRGFRLGCGEEEVEEPAGLLVSV